MYVNTCVPYIFERQAGGAWTQTAELTTSLSPNQMYGWSVALDDDVAVIGQYAFNQQVAYVYTGVTATPTEHEGTLPEAAALHGSYPNPFTVSTTLPYAMQAPGHVTIKVYDVLGQKVATLVDGVRPAGEQRVTWEAAGMPAGVYVVRMTAGSTTHSLTTVLRK